MIPIFSLWKPQPVQLRNRIYLRKSAFFIIFSYQPALSWKTLRLYPFWRNFLHFCLVYIHIFHSMQCLFMVFLTELLKVDIALHTKYYSFPKTDKIKVPVSLGRWFSWPILLLYIFICLFHVQVVFNQILKNICRIFPSIWAFYIIRNPQSRFQSYPISFGIGTSFKNCPDMPFL